MRRSLFLVALAAAGLSSTIAFATDARTDVFGNNGFWINDESNVYFNPAYVATYNNYLILEKGAGGGAYAKTGPFAYGIYLNRTDGAMTLDNFSVQENTLGGGTTAVTNTGLLNGLAATNVNRRPFDLVVGGDTGIKWGLGLYYNSAKATRTDNATYINPSYKQMDLRLGFDIGGFKPFIQYGIMRELGMETKTQVAEVDVALTGNQIISQKPKHMQVGAQMELGAGFTPYALVTIESVVVSAYEKATDKTFEVTPQKTTGWTVGTSKTFDIKNGRVYLGAGIASLKVTNDDGATASTKTVVSTTWVPLMAGVEASPLSWLTARAAAQYDLSNRRAQDSTPNAANSKTTSIAVPNAGTVAATVGATFKIGNFDIDTVLGNTGRDSGFTADAFAKIGVVYHL